MDKREREIFKVTAAGSVVNVLLTAFKFVAGIAGRSAAMTADAIHSLSDLVTDALVLVFVHIGSKPADKSHEYGHGKFETIASALIGMALMAVAGGIFFNAADKVIAYFHGGPLSTPGPLALWAAIVSILLKEGIYRYTAYKGRRLDSPALEANAWHHRSDALSSIGTLVGIGGAILLGGRWAILDPLASAAVACFLTAMAWRLLKESFDELTEASLPREVEKEILDIVASFPDVSDPHNLHTRRIGNRYAIEIHIRMPGDVSLLQAHSRTHDIEQAVRERFGPDTHITVHVEPVKPFPKD